MFEQGFALPIQQKEIAMTRIGKFAPLALSTITLVSGCGGGKGGSSSDRSVARQRAIASARLMRSMFAVASLGLNTAPESASSRAVRSTTHRSPIHRSRAAVAGFDEDAELYFVSSHSPDQSGRIDLFTDAAHAFSAGIFTCPAPEWKNNIAGSYPAMVHSSYDISAGDRKETHGTLDFTVYDSSGQNGFMHITLTNVLAEYAEADFNIDHGMISGTQQAHFPGDSVQWSCKEVDLPTYDGGMICTITYYDGSKDTIQMSPDGSSVETYYDPDGTLELTGDLEMDGTDSIDFSDISTEDVDVDTGEPPNDDSGSDSSDRSRRAARSSYITKHLHKPVR
jgi:hypothetical protein